MVSQSRGSKVHVPEEAFIRILLYSMRPSAPSPGSDLPELIQLASSQQIFRKVLKSRFSKFAYYDTKYLPIYDLLG